MRRTLKFIGMAAGLCLVIGTTACSDDDAVGPCGNGVIDTAEGEDCDGIELAGASCNSLGYASGTLTCSDQCTFDDTACEGSLCGNGVVDANEECDDTDLNEATCTSLGLEAGTLVCMNNCTFNTTGCGGAGNCGNSIIEGDEECDMFELGGATCVDEGFEGGDISCTVGCTLNTTDCYYPAVMDVGSACDADIDCNGGLCLTEVDPTRHWGQAGGYCYEPCDANGNCPLSGADGVCVSFTDSDFCMQGCDLSSPVCGPGQACEDIGSGVGVCFWARCTADSECVITDDCDTDAASDDFGWCVTPEENCTNGEDDDFDGKSDCSDPECTGETNCPIGEICGNTVDDDGDGVADCLDGECIDLGICTGQVCTAAAALVCGDVLTGESNFGTGSTDVIEGASCVDPDTGLAGSFFSNEWGPEYTYSFTVTEAQLVTVTVSNYTDDLDIYIIKDILGGCDPNRGCFEWGGEGAGVDEVMTFTAYPSMTYYVVVDGFEGNESTYDISVACATTGFETCDDDGNDNDGDGLVDCDDPECWGVGTCSTEAECGNGEDDDLDGAVDCGDDDCDSDVNCLPGTGYWELWERDGGVEFDLVGQALNFTADSSGQGYTYDASPQTGWLYAPGDGDASTMELTLGNNDLGENIGLPFAFPFDGSTHTDLYVLDNGYISFTNEGGWMPGPNGWNVYDYARIGPLWTDLDPAVGTVTFDSYGTYVVITWDGLLFDTATATTPNQFQLVLHANGDIQMTWLAVGDVLNQPMSTEGMVTIVGAEVGTPPTETNFN